MGYADDTEFASRNLIQLITHEENQLRRLQGELATATKKAEHFEWDFRSSELHDDFSDAYNLNAFQKMAWAQQETERLKADVATIEASIGARRFAIGALCGALLQICKQGIAIVYGDLGAAPTGRELDGIPVRDIAWQARNQALHYEEGDYNKHVKALFGRLADVYGEALSLEEHPSMNLARPVIELLGWVDYAQYRADLDALSL